MCGDVGRKQFRSMTRRSEKGRFPRNPLPQGKRERKEGRKEGKEEKMSQGEPALQAFIPSGNALVTGSTVECY